MPHAAKALLILASASVCFCGTASAQKFSGFKQRLKLHGSYHRSCVDYDDRHHNYRPLAFGYRRYHWNQGYNGHEIADIVRSRASANLVNAQARTQNEVARLARMENSVTSLHTYHQRRSINTERRFGHLHARGEYVRASKDNAKLVAHQAGLELRGEGMLTREEINAVTGELHWPLLLQMQHFDNARRPVNEVFVTRARVGQINPNHYLPLCDWVKKVSDELTRNLDHYSQADYAEAQSFLRRLLVEARLPASANTSMQFATK